MINNRANFFLIKEGGVLKNRIYLHSAICIVIIFGLFACGGGKYAEAEKVMKIWYARSRALDLGQENRIAREVAAEYDPVNELLDDYYKLSHKYLALQDSQTIHGKEELLARFHELHSAALD